MKRLRRKNWIYCVAMVAVVTGSELWTAQMWRVWFRNLSKQSNTAPVVPDRVILTLGADTLPERALTWRCYFRTTVTAVPLRFVVVGEVQDSPDDLFIPSLGR